MPLELRIIVTAGIGLVSLCLWGHMMPRRFYIVGDWFGAGCVIAMIVCALSVVWRA